jgi:hypothetical protein
MRIDDQSLDANAEQMIERVGDERPIGDRDERLRTPLRKGAEPRAKSGAEHERIANDTGHKRRVFLE